MSCRSRRNEPIRTVLSHRKNSNMMPKSGSRDTRPALATGWHARLCRAVALLGAGAALAAGGVASAWAQGQESGRRAWTQLNDVAQYAGADENTKVACASALGLADVFQPMARERVLRLERQGEARLAGEAFQAAMAAADRFEEVRSGKRSVDRAVAMSIVDESQAALKAWHAAENRAFATAAGRDRLVLLAYEVWVAGWAKEVAGRCDPRSSWNNDPTFAKALARLGDVADAEAVFEGWLAAFASSPQGKEAQSAVQDYVLGRSAERERQAQEARREQQRAAVQAERDAECARRREAGTAEQEEETETFSPMFVTRCPVDEALIRRLQERVSQAQRHHQHLAGLRSSGGRFSNLDDLLAYMEEVADYADGNDSFLDPAYQWNCTVPQHQRGTLMPRSKIDGWRSCFNRYLDNVAAYRDRLRDQLTKERRGR